MIKNPKNSTISKLDESCISNPKLEISDWTALVGGGVQFKISNFEIVQFQNIYR